MIYLNNIKIVATILTFSSILLSCSKVKEAEKSNKKLLKQSLINEYLYDVTGDSVRERMFVKSNPKDKFIKDIFIVADNRQEKVCSILPRYNSEYVKTSPPIENIYLEANDVQSHTKGFRIINRNTDLVADVMYFDLYFDQGWIVKTVGFIATNEFEKKFICSKVINLKLDDVRNREIVPSEFYKYLKDNKDCK